VQEAVPGQVLSQEKEKTNQKAGLVLTCSNAQNVKWRTKMCSDERLFPRWWNAKK